MSAESAQIIADSDQDQAWLAATNFLSLRAMKAKVDDELAKAKGRFIAAAKRAGVEEVETADGTVYWYPSSKRTADNEVARNILTGSQLDHVTVPTVVLKKLDAAIELGIITKNEAAQFITTTPYEAVKVK